MSPSPTDIVVLVPLKPFARAKSRLSGTFDDVTRARIAERLARHVLGVARASCAPGSLFVVADASLESFALEHGAKLLVEPVQVRSLAEVVDAALDALAARGARRAMVLMGDLPDVSCAALRALTTQTSDVVLAESESGLGTNALVVSLPRPFAMAFAEPESGIVHEARAKSANLSVHRVRDAALLRDLDRPSDLRSEELDALSAHTR